MSKPGLTKLQNDVIKIIKERQEREKAMLSNLIISIIRTGVPVLVGLITSYLTVRNIDVPESVAEWLTGLLNFVFSLVYYTIVRLLEKKYPNVGWLLGNPSKPTYK